ncbi:MAG: ribose ABC transporter permease [Butyricicoccus sp.]|nr:ribose ABC transporter permease [Butyricicoccus sp.]
MNKQQIKRISEKYGMLLVLIVMVAVISILEPNFFRLSNFSNVLKQISVYAIIGYGVTFIIITTGIDLGLGAYMALAGVVAAYLAQTTMPGVVSVLAGAVIGILIGLVNGLLISITRIPPFIATLGMTTITRGIALLITNGKPVSRLSESFRWWGGGRLLGIPTPIVWLIVLTVVSWILLDHMKFGQYTRAIGGNEKAAVISGINIFKYKVLIYTFGGFCCGLAGVILAARVASGSPSAADGYELDAIAGSVIGGTSMMGGSGSIFGVLIGAMVIGVLNAGLNMLGVSSYWQEIVKGVIIIVAVVADEQKNRVKA